MNVKIGTADTASLDFTRGVFLAIRAQKDFGSPSHQDIIISDFWKVDLSDFEVLWLLVANKIGGSAADLNGCVRTSKKTPKPRSA